jgi:tetratricopeptide (TPR) repeat protein
MSELERAHYTVGCMQVLLLQRKYAEVLQRGATLSDELLAPDPGKLLGKYGMMGIAKKALGDEAGARELLLKAKEIAQKYVSEAPEDFNRHGRLAEVLAWLGEKDAAIAEAKRGTELLPESIDAFDGPVATQTLAEIYVTGGEYDQALPIIDGLLSRPTQLTVAFIKIHPIYDAIRNDPRFIEILKKHGG